MAEYGMHRDVSTDYDETVQRVRDELAKEGFGVLTEIDVKATLKKKIDVDHRRYVILGACNPPLAHRALTAEPSIGVMLPCNVVVYERDGGGSKVIAFDPMELFPEGAEGDLGAVAQEVQERLQKVMEAL
jgi:uncharacterized protein (DUF302 family)